jgi:hypothetical protein
MTQSTDSYVRRGDRERRRRRMRRLLGAGGLVVSGALALQQSEPAVADAAAQTAPLAPLVRGGRLAAPEPVSGTNGGRAAAGRAAAPGVVAEHASALQRIRRWHRVYRLAGHYGVAPDLAVAIHDVALAEGIEPDLAFRLVRAESEFNERARSRVGAVGLTQVMPGTARHYLPGVSQKRLFERHLNLHVGFRYLRGLIHQYGSLRTALLVYNRGPVAVEQALKRGDDPANGYEEVVAKGYTGRGIVDR